MATFDAHKNFAISLVAVAPIPAASGTTFNVTASEGALFPTVPFNAVVWPAGTNPTAANAEIVRVTSKGTGDNWTVTRVTESSNARSIALGDQIAAAITAKTLTDVEAAFASVPGRIPGGRLTLTIGTPVTTIDVLAATTLYYALYTHNVIALYNGSAWVEYTFPELSIPVPATTAQMYDVFVYDNAGTRTLELTAWTNDTTRATALVRQDGYLVKSGATTRLYLGSFRTAAVSGQTENSVAKRYVWNNYNRVLQDMLVLEATNSWTYNTDTWRQANGALTNQLDFVIGIDESPVQARVFSLASASGADIGGAVAIGLDSSTVAHASNLRLPSHSDQASFAIPLTATLTVHSGAGRHTLVWLEKGRAAGTLTFYGDTAAVIAGVTVPVQAGISGEVWQ